MFRKEGVMNEDELRARNGIKWDTYTKKIQIEARVMGDLALNHIIPIATNYQSSLLDNVIKMETVLGKEDGDKLSKENISTVRFLASSISDIRRMVAELIEKAEGR